MKVSIIETVEVLMRIVETLQQDADDIIDCRVIFHGD